MNVYIAWACVIAYLACGVSFARNLVLYWWDNGIFERDSVAVSMAALGLATIWPLSLIGFLIGRWIWRPVTSTAERNELLRKEISAWRQLERSALTRRERAMARQVVDVLINQLGESRKR